MDVVALLAQKGGTGKTTLALSLAVAAQQDGKETLLIDLDPQGTACNWSDRRESESPLVLDVQPGRLPKALRKALEGGIQFTVIDTPPRSEQAAMAAAKVADLIVIPCRPQAYDLETIPNTRELISLAGDKPALVVLNGVPPQGSRHEQAKVVLQRLEMHICPAMLGHRAAFGDAGSLGETPLEYDPRGKAAEEIRTLYKYTSQLLDKYPNQREPDVQESKPSYNTG